jgi:hypothetical protein
MKVLRDPWREAFLTLGGEANPGVDSLPALEAILSRQRLRLAVAPDGAGEDAAGRAGEAVELDPAAPEVPVVAVHPRQVEEDVVHVAVVRRCAVLGDVAGQAESPVYAIADLRPRVDRLAAPDGGQVRQISTRLPDSDEHYSVKWDGEWHITYEVFRDMGAAFAVVLVLIYILTVAWFRSFTTPLVIMIPIPLSLVGILPAHGALSAFALALTFFSVFFFIPSVPAAHGTSIPSQAVRAAYSFIYRISMAGVCTVFPAAGAAGEREASGSRTCGLWYKAF